MSDLISRQDAINAIKERDPGCWEDACYIIENLPSAKPKIIGCKDCKYYLDSKEKCELIDTRLHFYETNKTWDEGCFCSWAERRST